MKKKTALMLILFVMLIGIISSSGMFKTDVSEALPTNSYETLNSLKSSNLKAPKYDPRWWNLTYRYRIPIEVSEPGVLSRVYEPVKVTLVFNPAAHVNSIRLLYYNETSNSWSDPLPVQVVPIEKNGDYITSATITFYANVSINEIKRYYIYYTDQPVEKLTFPTDLKVSTLRIENSYFSWWLKPPNPKILRYPNTTGADWNTIDNGWIGYPSWDGTTITWNGAELNSSDVELLYSDVLEEEGIGPIYAKVVYKYRVLVEKRKIFGWLWEYYYNNYTITFTIYAQKPLVKVDFQINDSDNGIYRGVWGTVMDVDGDRDDDKYAFFTDPLTTGNVTPTGEYYKAENDLEDYNGWTWAALYEPGRYGVGVIVHKNYTSEYHPLYVTRDVSGLVNNYTFIFVCIDGYNGTYYYRFFDIRPSGNAWDPVSETTKAIAYPLSVTVYSKQEAYYFLEVTVTDMLSRSVENASVFIYDSDANKILPYKNVTSSLGKATLKFYYNKTFTAIVKVNYTEHTGDNKIFVEKNITVSLDLTRVRELVNVLVTLDLVDLYVYVENLDGTRISGANVIISNSSFGYELSESTDTQGVAYFYRILGHTEWLINITYVTSELKFIVKNDTEMVSIGEEGNQSITIILQMSDLQITAVDMLNKTVNEYTVFLYQGIDPLNNEITRKDAVNGKVVFKDLPVGNFTLTFKYSTKTEYGEISYGEFASTVINVLYPSNRNIVVTLPLANIYITLVDVNDAGIPNVTLYISYELITFRGVSNKSGEISFSRILFNVTWNIHGSFEPFGGKVEPISIDLDVLLDSPEKNVTIRLPITDMVIHVLTEEQRSMEEYWKYGVGGAVVYANITGEMVLITNATDPAGYAVAKFVPIGRYNVTVYFLEQSWSRIFDVYSNSTLDFVLPFKYAQVTTRLSVTSPSSSYVNVIWTENITVELTFYVVETNAFIAYGWVNWSLVDMQGNTVLSGFGSYNEEHEVYFVSFNSSEVPAGQYTLKIYGGKTSYPPPSTEVVVVVEVSKVPTELILEKERIRVPVGSDYVSIRVFYKDIFHNASIVNASVILTLENQSYQMIPDEENPGWYVYDLPVSNLSMGVYEVKVYAEKTNYKPVEESISLQITEKVIKIGTFSIPRTIFFASIIGIGVPVAGIAGFYTYRYFRVPKVLRTLNKIISKVEKGERIPLDAVANVRSRRDIVSEKVNKLWRNLGVKFGGVREEGKESG